jgi:hypothetical protein
MKQTGPRGQTSTVHPRQIFQWRHTVYQSCSKSVSDFDSDSVSVLVSVAGDCLLIAPTAKLAFEAFRRGVAAVAFGLCLNRLAMMRRRLPLGNI